MEVLSGLGGLFGMGGGSGTSPSVMGKGLLQPDILGQAKDLTSGSGGFNAPQSASTNPIFSKATLSQIEGVNKKAQENVRNAMPMMQLGPVSQQPQIQQMDLVSLLRTLGGGQ